MGDMGTAETLGASVALTTYNGERFLERQLQSLAEQSELPRELVVTDDQSSDGTVPMLERFAADAPFPVRIELNEQRLGYRRNFRKAAQLCTGDLILFCDQDDVWLPQKIAELRAAFADPATLLVYHNALLVDAEEKSLGRMLRPETEHARLAERPLHPWHYSFGLLQAFRSSLRDYDDLWDLSRDQLEDEILAHDQWYFFLALALDGVRFLDRDLLLYRQHGANTYGANMPRNTLQRLAARFVHEASADRRGAIAAERRADILRLLEARVPAELRERVREVATMYACLGPRLDRRYRTYTRASLPARLGALGTSVASNDYCGNPWGFDWRSIPRDLVSGVIRGGAEGD